MSGGQGAPSEPGLVAVRPILGLVAVLCLWLAAHAYPGVIHDARLYAIQAIAQRDPARFAADLYFEFGSQDRFTVFSLLYAPLIAQWGLAVAHAALAVVAQAGWLGAAWLLATALVPALPLRLWAMAGLVLLPGAFGYDGTFRYAEPFVTPRIFVEALTFLALTLALRGRWLGAAAVLAGAAALHPLMALPGIGVVALLGLLRYRRAWAVAAAVAACALPLLLPLVPESLLRLVPRVDPDWRAVIAGRSPFNLVSWWTWVDYVNLATQAALCAFAILLLRGAMRRVAVAATVVAVAGFLLSWVAGDLLGIHVVVAGQPWRAVWLMAALGNLLLVPALAKLWAGGLGAVPTARPALLTLLGALALTTISPGNAMALPPLLLLAAIHVGLHVARWRPAGPAVALLAVALAVCIGWAVAVLAVGTAFWLDTLRDAPWIAPRFAALAALALALLAVATVPRVSRRVPPLPATAFAAVLLAVSVATLDKRTPLQRLIEDPQAQRAGLQAFLPPQGRIFWDGGAEILWLLLERPSFFSCIQSAGVGFFRDKAMAFRDRGHHLDFQRLEGRCVESLTPAETPPTRAALQRACRAEPLLDTIIVQSRVDGLPAPSWTLPVARTRLDGGGAQPAGEVFRYDCANLR